jgi:hypothetical protein
MLTVIETPIFQRMVDGVWSASEREAFIAFISDNPQAGDVIPGAESLRKVRWKRDGMGKSGGARVIDLLHPPRPRRGGVGSDLRQSQV